MKPNSFDHPKTERFAELLGIRLREAWGMLDRLMALTQQYAERGQVGAVFTDTQLARRLDWAGQGEEAANLIWALVSSGFLDEHPVHRYVIHDWPDHAPDYTKRKVKESERGWAVTDVPENSGDDPENSSRVHGPSLPFLPLPSPSVPLNGADAPTTEPRVDGFISMLTGTIPIGLHSETWDSPRDWLFAHKDVLIAEAQLKAGEDNGSQFNRAFKAIMMRWWNSKSPPARLGRKDAPDDFEKASEEVMRGYQTSRSARQ